MKSSIAAGDLSNVDNINFDQLLNNDFQLSDSGTSLLHNDL